MTLSKFWHRRICEVTMFVSAVVVALYFVQYFDSPTKIADSLIVSDIGAIISAATFVISFLMYLWVSEKYINVWALIVYFALAANSAALIVSTGKTASPFLALWIVVGVFAPVFAWRAVIPMLIAAASLAVYLYMQHGFLVNDLIIVLLAGLVPIIAGYSIWHRRPVPGMRSSQQSFHQLASELSQVASKSDVVIRAIADGVIAVNNKNQIELINPSAQRILGWGKSDALGLNYHSVLKLSDSKDQELTNASDPIQLALASNQENQTNSLSATTEAGKKMLLGITVSPIGQPGEGVIVVFRDITREKAEERQQTEFISTASHEMRTPVASIEGYLGLALNPATATVDEKARDFIQKAHESAQHLGRLFQDLLDVSKADDGRLSNNPKIVDVVAFVGDIVEGLRPKALEKQLRLFYKPNPDSEANERALSPVFYSKVDNDHLREVISNLVENAIKYTPQGDVVVDVNGDEEHVVISVVDSGIGIPHEDISHLFQKFYRVDNSATREIGGTGLGLYLCRRLAEIMQGRIWVESEFKKGSTFYLELPRTSREEAMHALESAADQPEESPLPIIQEIHAQSAVTAPTPPAEAVNQNIAPPVVETPILEQSPAQPTAEPAPPPAPTVAATPTNRANIPLSNIEQNPAAYTSHNRAPSIQIPVRNPGEQNKP